MPAVLLRTQALISSIPRMPSKPLSKLRTGVMPKRCMTVQGVARVDHATTGGAFPEPAFGSAAAAACDDRRIGTRAGRYGAIWI
jgi:hypothetical protein